jgi:large subunit ribosomal protein L6
VTFEIPKGLTVECPQPTLVIIRGADKQLVGQFAAEVRRVRPPEPYKGKGVRYVGEAVVQKAGKTFVSGEK